MEQVVSMQEWLEALESGNYRQTEGSLCMGLGDGAKAYCCLGVLEEVVYGTKWYNEEDDGNEDIIYADEYGETEMLPRELAEPLGLEAKITEEEANRLELAGITGTKEYPRKHVLATLNDEGWSFENIADMIRELGWDK